MNLKSSLCCLILVEMSTFVLLFACPNTRQPTFRISHCYTKVLRGDPILVELSTLSILYMSKDQPTSRISHCYTKVLREGPSWSKCLLLFSSMHVQGPDSLHLGLATVTQKYSARAHLGRNVYFCSVLCMSKDQTAYI